MEDLTKPRVTGKVNLDSVKKGKAERISTTIEFKGEVKDLSSDLPGDKVVINGSTLYRFLKIYNNVKPAEIARRISIDLKNMYLDHDMMTKGKLLEYMNEETAFLNMLDKLEEEKNQIN